MTNITKRLWNVKLLIFLSVCLMTCAGCSWKAGNTVQVHAFGDTLKLEGKDHKAVYGAGHSIVVRVAYFKTGQILEANHIFNEALVVVNGFKLNRALAPYEQGLKKSTPKILRAIFYKYCRVYTFKEQITTSI